MLRYVGPGQFIKKKVEIPCDNAGTKIRTKMVQLDCDIIGEDFWTENPHLLDQFKETC